MSKLTKVILGFVIVFTFSMMIGTTSVWAVTVKLKSGKKLRGPVVGRNFREITVATKNGRITIPYRDINAIHQEADAQDRDVYTIKKELKEYKRQQRRYERDPVAAKERQRKSIQKSIEKNRRKRELEWKKNTPLPKRLKEKRKSGEQHPKGRKKYKG